MCIIMLYKIHYVCIILDDVCIVLFVVITSDVQCYTNSVITMNGLNNDDYLATLFLFPSPPPPPPPISDVFMWFTSPQDEKMYGPSVP